jgi:hypothetical protein
VRPYENLASGIGIEKLRVEKEGLVKTAQDE